MEDTQIVKEGYEKIARTYLKERQKLKTGKYLEAIYKLLPDNADVLDVGCGAGTPVDDELIKRGYGVVGIDISEEQIKLARKLCKGGDFRVFDMLDLKRGQYAVSLVICLYTMFHISRSKHQEMLHIFASYLNSGGLLFLTMGDSDFEGEHKMFGTKMWSSQWGRGRNLEMVKRAGFEIVWEEINTTASEKHQVILARKQS